jgi:hypothetical protein
MVDRMLSDAQIDEFVERGYLVVPQVVTGDVLDSAVQRIDEITVRHHPPPTSAGPTSIFSTPRTSRP